MTYIKFPLMFRRSFTHGVSNDVPTAGALILPMNEAAVCDEQIAQLITHVDDPTVTVVISSMNEAA